MMMMLMQQQNRKNTVFDGIASCSGAPVPLLIVVVGLLLLSISVVDESAALDNGLVRLPILLYSTVYQGWVTSRLVLSRICMRYLANRFSKLTKRSVA